MRNTDQYQTCVPRCGRSACSQRSQLDRRCGRPHKWRRDERRREGGSAPSHRSRGIPFDDRDASRGHRWCAVLTRGILRQSGPIVTATLRVGWIGPGSVLTGPLSTLKSGPVDKRFVTPSFAITVRNSGNAATKVNSVSVASDAGLSYSDTKSLAGPTPVFKLDGQSSEIVCVQLETVIAAIETFREVNGSASRRLRAEVSLGSGATVCSSWESLP
jgi:hypothetical protein